MSCLYPTGAFKRPSELSRRQRQFQKLPEGFQVAFAAEVIDVVVICAAHDIELLWLIGRCVKGIRVLHRDLLIAGRRG